MSLITVKTTANLNVRSGPGTKYPVLKTLLAGTEISQVDIDGWTPIVLVDQQLGFVSSAFLVDVSPDQPGEPIITGEMLLAQASKHLGQKYVLGADVPLNNPDYKGPWDCAEMITYDVYQVTGKVYGALNPQSSNPEPYTGEWLRQINNGMVIGISVDEALRTPGAILLRFDNSVKHIVFSDGKGGTIEAKGTKYGVVRDKVKGRGFKYGILIPGVKYQETK